MDTFQKKKHKWLKIHEKCLIALAMREMQIITMTYLHITVKMAFVKKNVAKDERKKEYLYTICGNVN
jgi:hypothetical protein